LRESRLPIRFFRSRNPISRLHKDNKGAIRTAAGTVRKVVLAAVNPALGAEPITLLKDRRRIAEEVLKEMEAQKQQGSVIYLPDGKDGDMPLRTPKLCGYTGSTVGDKVAYIHHGNDLEILNP
jgi:hypothetical protein